MHIIKTPEAMRKLSSKAILSGRSIGMVPTMGALHAGHVSLIERARKENDIVVVSIFVNPKQFGPAEDYLRYPRPLDKDKKCCKQAGVDYLFVPKEKDIYPKGFQTSVTVEKLQETMCGLSRPGHFRGVATIVLKLMNIVKPSKAYFGEKDFQQLAVIKRMAKDLNVDSKVLGCPIIREQDGLAMSSRNVYLTPAQRIEAAKLRKALLAAGRLIKINKVYNPNTLLNSMRAIIKTIPDHRIDYITVSDPESLVQVRTANPPVLIALAVFVGKTRLLDNIVVK